MAQTTNKALTLPSVGGDDGTWGTEFNSGVITALDNILGAVDAISLSATNYTLSSTEIQNLTLKLSGSLLANVSVYSACVGFFCVENNCTGNFAVTMQAVTSTSYPSSGSTIGSGYILPQGARSWFVSDQIVGLRPCPTWLAQLMLAVSGATPLTLRRTENNVSPQTVLSIQSGSGSGNAYTLQETGDGSNNVASLTEIIGSTTLATKSVTGYGFSIPVQLSQISTPSAPSSGTDFLYAKSGDILAYQGSSGIERNIGIGAPYASLVSITNNSGTPNTQANVTVSGSVALVAPSTGFMAYVNAPGTVTINFATTGANGMDTGSLPTSAPVYIYGIYNPSTSTWAGLGTAISPLSGGPTLPSGYVYQVYLGEMMTDSNPHLRASYQTGKRVTYTSPPSVGTGTITYVSWFPPASEAAIITGTTVEVLDMNNNMVTNFGHIASGSGGPIGGFAIVPNTGGTTFSISNLGGGSSANAYGWFSRANVT